MDATEHARTEEKLRLFKRLAEILVEEQRGEGVFEGTPHLGELERASRSLGQQLGRVSLERVAAEVVATHARHAVCPRCGKSHALNMRKRLVQSLDGPVELLEAVAHCSACRRDFFPSA